MADTGSMRYCDIDAPEVAAADQQRDLTRVPGEPDDRLARRVAAAHHDDLGTGAGQRLVRPGPVVDPRAEQVIDP